MRDRSRFFVQTSSPILLCDKHDSDDLAPCMAISRIFALGTIILLVTTCGARSQGLPRVERFAISSFDSLFTLSEHFVVPGSLRLVLDDSIPLSEPGDYRYEPESRQVVFTLSFRVRSFADTIRARLLTVEYRFRPIPIRDVYALRRLEEVADSASSGIGAREASGRSVDQGGVFGTGFQKSGSIIRGVTIGSNRDLTLQSGLRLQFSGKISEDVEVLAALTDEQSPIQPEGTTQTLREVDNIFFEVRSPWVGGILGKFVVADDAGRFTTFDRKLQGIKINARAGRSGGETRALYAVSPGRFKTESFVGREGDQGPYRLTGLSNERDIVVVAGSERVYVDGVLMTRGDNQDYVIDYAAAQITFAARRPITSASRVTVDFEYTDQKYSRSFVALSHTLPLADSAVILSTSYLREGDDPDATINITLSEADRALLASIGGDRRRAFRSGARLVGRSDSVLGTYIRIDTVLNGRPDSIFVYDPANPLAVYDVVFSIPPDGVGDYRSVAFGQYEFVGKGLGAYLPLVYLPLPQLRQVGALAASVKGNSGVVRGDLAFSGSSLNRLSADPGADLAGMALSIEAAGWIDSASTIGETRLTGRLRYISSGFRGIDRVAEVEFDNHWNTGGRPGETGRSDLISEAELAWNPIRRLALHLSGGLLDRQREFRSIRSRAAIRLEPVDRLPGADYSLEAINADSSAGFRSDLWLRQNAGVSWPLGSLTPGFRFAWERRMDRESASDTIAPTSFRYLEFGPDLALDLGPLRSTLSYRHRLDDSIRGEGADRRFVSDGGAETFRLHGELAGGGSLTSQLDVTWRLRSFNPVAGVDPAGRLDNSALIIRSRTRWSGLDRALDLNAEYEGQSERAARLQRLFIRVPFGRGEYIWIDLDGNGVQSIEEFRLTNAGDGEYVPVTLPTEDLFPVTDVRASLRLRTQPGRFVNGESMLGRLLSPLTTETTLRLDEKNQSKDDAAIYLLQLSRYQDDSTTITGSSIVQQDVTLFESKNEFSTRFRFQDRRGLVRLVTSIERTRALERSLRLRWRPTYDIGLQFDLGFNRGSLFSSDSLSRRTYNLSTTIGTGDLGYRPDESWEIGWTLTVASTDDFIRNPVRSTTRNTNILRAVYSIENSGRFHVDIERTNVAGVNVGQDVFSLPYQLTDGYSIGTTWVGRASFEYRFGDNTQASISYTGRVQPLDRRLFNIGTAEVRAYF